MISQKLLKGIVLVGLIVALIGSLAVLLMVLDTQSDLYVQFFASTVVALFSVLVGYVLARFARSGRVTSRPRDSLVPVIQSVNQAFSGVSDGYWLVDEHGLIQYANQSMNLLMEDEHESQLDSDFRRILTNRGVTPRCLAEIDRAFGTAQAGTSTRLPLELHLQAPQTTGGLELCILPLVTEVSGGQGAGRVMVLIREKAEAVRKNIASDALERCLDAIDLPLMVIDCSRPGLQLRFANAAFVRFGGESYRDLLLQKPLDTLAGLIQGADFGMLRDAIQERSPTSLLTTRRDFPDATSQQYRIDLAQIYGKPGHVLYQVLTFTDVTEIHHHTAQLAYRAAHDALTGLPNRAAFQEALDRSFRHAASKEGELALLFINLDEFKPVNDVLGYTVGDQLLMSVAQRLRRLITGGDTLARFSGDQFVILMNKASQPDAVQLAQLILEDVAQAHQVAEREVHLTASIGVAIPEPGDSVAERLLQKADMAMQRAKQNGRNTFEVYDSSLARTLERRFQMRNELQEAFDSGGLEIHYQSIVDASGGLAGFEALMRWQHKQRGTIPPSDFIALAEATGQIAQLTRWCLRQACLDAKVLVDSGILTGRVSVNISSTQFHRFNFLDLVSGILDETGLAPEYLELELTETVLMRDIQAARELIDALTAIGVTTSIDDFGTGFSSLSYLSTLPVSKIKIDQSFVKHVEVDLREASVCRGVIAMAQRLNMEVVAEGVETESQYSYLRRHGCNYFQGFLFSRPETLDHLLRDYQMHGAVSEAFMSANAKI